MTAGAITSEAEEPDHKQILDELLEELFIAAFFKRGDFDETKAGLWLDFIEMFKRGQRERRHGEYLQRPEYRWYQFMRDNSVGSQMAMKIASIMHFKFATYEDGVSWLAQRAREQRVKMYSTYVQLLSYGQDSLVLEQLNRLPNTQTSQ